jgi:diguanylate cyclase (GGDEF)-like protein/PAS domain S-box-containing protein
LAAAYAIEAHAMKRPFHILVVGSNATRSQQLKAACVTAGHDWQFEFCASIKDVVSRLDLSAAQGIILHGEHHDISILACLRSIREQQNRVIPVLLVVQPDDESILLSAFRIGIQAYLIQDASARCLSLLPTLLDRIMHEAEKHHAINELLQESEARFLQTFDHAPIGMALVSLDGKWLKINQSLCDIVGYEEDELLSLSFKDLTHAEDFQIDQTFVQLVLADQIKKYQMETRYFHKQGHIVPIMLNASLVRHADGSPRYFILRIEDQTQRKKMEDALFAEKDFAQTTLQSIGDAVITTDAEGKVNYLNPNAEHLTGWSDKEALGLPLEQVFVVIQEATREVAESPLSHVLAQGKTWSFPGNVLLIAKHGAEYSIDNSVAPIRVKDGTINGAVLVFRDVTEVRAQNYKISYQASHDALTGLWNRSEFESMATRLLHSAKVMQMHHALLYLDLDQFKIVNDTCGHLAGDQLLCQLSNLLLRNTRKSDMLARLGGDEFGILLDSCPPDRAKEIAQHIVDIVRAFRFEWEGKLFSVGVSVGLIFITNQTRDLQSLLSGADTACYIAKDKGRNRVQVFEPQDEEVQDRHVQMDWVARINKAIEQNQFVFYFQRIVPIDESLMPTNYEILLRYKDEDGRLLLPLAFIPAAERYGLLPAIDRWVISTLLRQPPMALLEEIVGSQGKAFIAINLSSATINEPGFQEFVVRELEASSIPAAQICFEIMETAAITNLHRVIEFIFTMKTRGCLFSLDDFGSGLSSFGYLKSLPVDYLKIDSAFVKGIAKDKVDYAMVESIQRIGKVMGIKTIAKGVESAEVLQQLQAIGVNHAQGFELHVPELL